MSRFVKHRLGRVHDAMARHVGDGTLPLAVTALSRDGEVHVDALATEPDTIFRISSMTKPIAAVGAMVLVEECVLRLDDPIAEFLPELADRRVLTDPAGPLEHTVPAEREITLRDLLTFRNGFGMTFPGGRPIDEAAAELCTLGPPKPMTRLPLDQWLAKLGELPLMHQPGTRWLYNTGSDILGALLTRASGQDLETFLTERIFTPLGMVDTAFSVPAEKLGRFTVSYMPNQQTGELEVFDEVDGAWSEPPVFPSAAGGLVSTAADMLAFGSLFFDDKILSRAAITTMTTDHLTPQQKAESGFFPGYFDNLGWGFGVSVDTRRDSLYQTPGRFGWDGGLGTSLAIDPAEGLVGVLLTQRAAFPQFSQPYLDFWTSAYQALA